MGNAGGASDSRARRRADARPARGAASGAGVGIYSREGTTFTIHFLVNMQDGTQNLDEVVFNAFTRELAHDVYVVQ